MESSGDKDALIIGLKELSSDLPNELNFNSLNQSAEQELR